MLRAAFEGCERVGDSSTDDEIRWVKAAIDVFNSAAADSPRLYYAGVRSNVVFQDYSTFDPGITILTACQSQLGAAAVTGIGTGVHDNKAQIVLARSYLEAGSCLPGQDYLWWADPADSPKPLGIDATIDFVGTVVHEVGHALGLQHPEQDALGMCDVAFPSANNAAAVMRTDTDDWRRRLRRDDIEGLRELWSNPGRTVYETTSTTVPPTTSSWSAAQSIYSATLATNTPVVLSNASRASNQKILAGFTNSADEVRYFTGDWSGWDTSANGGLNVENPSGQPVYAYEHVAVAGGTEAATGRDRFIVAWYGNDKDSCCPSESLSSLDNSINFRVNLGGTWLAHQGTHPTKYKNLGMGYDPKEDRFVLAYIDVCQALGNSCSPNPDEPDSQWIFVRTIKAWLGGGGCTQALTTAEHVLDVGDVACDYRGGTDPTQCIIPVSTTAADGGPELRFIEGTIKQHDGYICFVRNLLPGTPLTMEGTLSLGQTSAALDAYDSYGVMLGGHVPGFAAETPSTSGYSFIFTMDRGGFGKLDGVMDNTTTFTTDYWPLHVGSQARLIGSPHVQWRVITYGP